MRTVKRATRPLNPTKRFLLDQLCKAYAQEKGYWLDVLKSNKYQGLLGAYREIRNEAVKNGYQSHYDLQAHHWKLCLQDAVETWDRYWQSLFTQISPYINKRFTDENEKHYAYWLLKGYPQFSKMMMGEMPTAPFEITSQTICNYLQRITKSLKGKSPHVKIARHIKFDKDCYEVFEKNGNQYLKLMTLEPRKRLVIPLRRLKSCF